MRERYAKRKAARVCTDCSTKLEQDDGVKCQFCSDLDASRQLGYRRRPAARRQERKRSARRRAEHRAKGICVFCTAPASSGRAACDLHRERAVKATQAWRERKKQGITRFGYRRSQPTVDPSRLDTYVPFDEQERGAIRGRLLRALRFFDWVTASDLLDALGLPMDVRSREYNGAAVVLSRVVKGGQVERRGRRNAFEYRITELGRAEIAERRAA